jgi:hypothetical protein
MANHPSFYAVQTNTHPHHDGNASDDVSSTASDMDCGSDYTEDSEDDWSRDNVVGCINEHVQQMCIKGEPTTQFRVLYRYPDWQRKIHAKVEAGALCDGYEDYGYAGKHVIFTLDRDAGNLYVTDDAPRDFKIRLFNLEDDMQILFQFKCCSNGVTTWTTVANCNLEVNDGNTGVFDLVSWRYEPVSALNCDIDAPFKNGSEESIGTLSLPILICKNGKDRDNMVHMDVALYHHGDIRCKTMRVPLPFELLAKVLREGPVSVSS